MDIIKNGFRFMLSHIVFIILSMTLMLMFAFLVEWIGVFGYSLITAYLYLAMVYSDGWRMGKKEGKSYSGIKPDFKRAFAAALVPVFFAVVLAIVTFIFPLSPIMNTVNRIYFAMYTGFFPEGAMVSWWQLLVCAIPAPFISAFGYKIGIKQYSVIEAFMVRFNIKPKPRKRRVYK